MYWLPYRSVSRPICALHKTRVSLYVRASQSSVFSSSVLFFFQKKQIQITDCFSQVRGFFFAAAQLGGRRVMTVVQYQQQVQNRAVL